MTIGQLLESLHSKACCLKACTGDASPFKEVSTEKIGQELEKRGYHPMGLETFRCGKTGKKIKMKVFCGVVHYQRLKHMIDDKIHSRTRGPRSVLMRQPMEGRARRGGLRMGEMEKDAVVAHGCSFFLQDRLLYASDYYEQHVCSTCGLPGISHFDKSKAFCSNPSCNGIVLLTKIPYATKILFDELMALHILPRINFQKKK